MPLQPAFLLLFTELIHAQVVLAHTAHAMADSLREPRENGLCIAVPGQTCYRNQRKKLK